MEETKQTRGGTARIHRKTPVIMHQHQVMNDQYQRNRTTETSGNNMNIRPEPVHETSTNQSDNRAVSYTHLDVYKRQE